MCIGGKPVKAPERPFLGLIIRILSIDQRIRARHRLVDVSHPSKMYRLPRVYRQDEVLITHHYLNITKSTILGSLSSCCDDLTF
jgi:hypothetical protein